MVNFSRMALGNPHIRHHAFLSDVILHACSRSRHVLEILESSVDMHVNRKDINRTRGLRENNITLAPSQVLKFSTMSPSTVPSTQSSTVEERGEVMKWYNQLVEIPLEQGVGLVHAPRRGDGPCNNPGQHSLTLNMSSLSLHLAAFCSASYYMLHTHSSNSVSPIVHQVQPYNLPISLLCCALHS